MAQLACGAPGHVGVAADARRAALSCISTAFVYAPACGVLIKEKPGGAWWF
jgi:hypothetical protein